ncbi:O-antigen ligase family protein [Gallibacterium salpingitidis]|uniref:O-antigen ligase family protein n=1 Tax=Gallibacterium salpingitidis TaxID=505341 RepID=UPI0009EDD9AC|nr:O-antigen ligase family protein [Gallibacterium salpingitidis]
MNLTYHHYLKNFSNLVVCYFFITLVILPKAYGVGIILPIIAIFFIFTSLIKDRTFPKINQDYYYFLYPFIIYFILYIFCILFHQDSIKVLDGPSRALFFLLIFFIPSNYTISLKILLFSIPFGGIATAIYAVYQKFILNYDRALSDTTYVIQSGDMSMSLGVFNLVLMFYCWQKRQYYLALFCAFGSLGGMLGSFLSATRGGWLLMPFIVVILFYLNRNSLSKKIIIGFLTSLVLIFITLLSIPSTKVLSQIENARTEIRNFGQEENAGTSVGARLELWQASLISIQEKPIFGWGHEGAKEQRKLQGSQGILAQYPASLGHAHNQYINDTLERGVIGLFALLGIFLLPLWQYFKAYRENNDHLEIKLLATLGIIHITSVMSYGLTQVFFAHNSGNMFYFFLTVLFYAMILNYKNNVINPKNI